MSELKPCPWCKEKPKAYTDLNINGHKMYAVGCVNDDCEVQPSTMLYDNYDFAVEVWNRMQK